MKNSFRLMTCLLVTLTPFVVAAGPMEIAQGDSTAPYFIGASFATWAVFLGYVLFVSLRQNNLRKDLETLRKIIRDREK